MSRTSFRLRLTSTLAVITMVAYTALAWHYGASQALAATTTLPKTTPIAAASPLSWPGYGQAAVGAEGYGLLATNGVQTAVPTASTTKIMTAYAVLKVKPLTAGQQASPIITLTQADVDIYNDFYANDGSVAAVKAGEQISEYQALQALLLPSANNMADSLAVWAFGSTANYVAYANDLAQQLGMTNTHIEDASGFSPQTVSTAQDLVRLALAAMKEPVFAEIVSQSTATIPVAGVIHNVNGLLGRDNIVGVKTGNTDEAGGCFVAAAKHVIGGKTITVVTAIMAAPDLTRSMLDSLPLLASAKANFVRTVVLPAGTTAGYYTVPSNGTRAFVKTTKDIIIIAWKGTKLATDIGIKDARSPLKGQSTVGTVYVHGTGVNASTSLRISTDIPAPGLSWRLRHPF